MNKFPHSWLITEFVTRLTWRVPLEEHELLTLPDHLNSPPAFSGVCVIRSLVLCVCFVDRCLSFLYIFWPFCCMFFLDWRILVTPLWYLQTLLLILNEKTITTLSKHLQNLINKNRRNRGKSNVPSTIFLAQCS